MEHIFWLIPNRLAGRPGPDEEAWDITELRDGGIGAILSVNDGWLCDPQALATAGIAYALLPLSDWVPPQPGDAEHCLRVLPQAYDFVTSQMEQGRSVVVHCSAGKDRTGLFLSYFLIREQGLSPDDAIREVRKVRPIALSAEGWEAFARELLQRIA